MQAVLYLKIDKLLNFHFMTFDRYEIHIQDFEEFVTGFFIIRLCIQNYKFEMVKMQMPHLNISKFQIPKLQKVKKLGTLILQKIRISDSQMWK